MRTATSIILALLLADSAGAQVLVDFTGLVDGPGNGELNGTEFRSQGLDLSTPPGDTLNVGCSSPTCLSSDQGVDDFSGSLRGDFVVPVSLDAGVVFAPFEIDLCCNPGPMSSSTTIRIFDAEGNLLKQSVDADMVYRDLTPIAYFTVDFDVDGMWSLEYEEVQAYDPDVVTFLDPLLDDWNALEIVDTSAGGASFFSGGLLLVGGNPDAYRFVTHTTDPGTLTVGHFRSMASYDPSTEGSLSTLDTAFDAIHLNPAPGASVEMAPLLLQGGSYYAPTAVTVSDSIWTSFSQMGLIAADFTLVAGGGPGNPDFSSSGSTISFGLLTSTTSSSAAELRETGFDNWRFTLNKGPVIVPSQVPALSPGVVALAALTLALAAVRATRRRGSGTALELRDET